MHVYMGVLAIMTFMERLDSNGVTFIGLMYIEG